MNKFYNGIMGLVVGDALGVPVEFKKRDTFTITDMTGYGTYNQPPGTWSDDSSLTLATLDSMIKLGKVDPADIMQNFFHWLNDGMFTPYGKVFDVGGGTRRAIARYANGKDAAKCGGKTRTEIKGGTAFSGKYKICRSIGLARRRLQEIQTSRGRKADVSDAYDACAGDGRSVGKRGRL